MTHVPRASSPIDCTPGREYRHSSSEYRGPLLVRTCEKATQVVRTFNGYEAGGGQSAGILFAHRLATFGLSLIMAFSCTPSSLAAQAFAKAPPSYDELTARRARKGRPSNMPTSSEAAALLHPEKQDLFTPDAWQGMLRISQYVEYVEGLEAVEEAEPACVDGRLQLEKAWQVVANEYFDPHGSFSQAAWAQQLHQTLQGAGGCLHNRADTYRALKSMMASLGDRYTEFLVPTRFRQALRRPQPAERDYLEAQATGVGLLVGERASEGGWRVEGALAESPAEEAGILQGDRITELDGYPTDALTRNEMVALLRGPSGSAVVLGVARPGLARPHAVYLERRPLPQPPLKVARVLAGSARPPVAYVREHYVSSAATRAMAAALRAAEAEGCAGVIVDVRNDPGGVFEEAIAQASFFLEEGQPVVATVRNEEVVDNTWRAGRLSGEVFPGKPGRLTRLPVVLLVNAGTASAAEVLTGALHDNHRAVVVGQKTFGKGVVQYYFPLDDQGSGIKVTVAKYLTPAGYDITRRGGLEPDVICNDFPHGGLPTASDDRCIAAALKIIQSTAG